MFRNIKKEQESCKDDIKKRPADRLNSFQSAKELLESTQSAKKFKIDKSQKRISMFFKTKSEENSSSDEVENMKQEVEETDNKSEPDNDYKTNEEPMIKSECSDSNEPNDTYRIIPIDVENGTNNEREPNENDTKVNVHHKPEKCNTLFGDSESEDEVHVEIPKSIVHKYEKKLELQEEEKPVDPMNKDKQSSKTLNKEIKEENGNIHDRKQVQKDEKHSKSKDKQEKEKHKSQSQELKERKINASEKSSEKHKLSNSNNKSQQKSSRHISKKKPDKPVTNTMENLEKNTAQVKPEEKPVKNKQEIGQLVVHLLMPAYAQKKFESKDVFKAVARKISHSILNKGFTGIFYYNIVRITLYILIYYHFQTQHS